MPAAMALFLFSVNCLAATPGGIPVPAISDEFDTLGAMWGPGLRGMPEALTIQNGILSFRSVDNGDDPYPSAEDMVSTYASQIGRPLSAAEGPSVVAWVWLPPFAEWPVGTNASDFREWFGVRVTAYDASLPYYDGWYWPGIYVATDDQGPCFLARTGDGLVDDVTIGRISTSGWWTLGLAWNAEGRTEYYAAPGRVTLAQKDLLYTTPTYNIADANRSMDQVIGSYLALRMSFPPTGKLSPDWRIDRIGVYVKVPSSITPVPGDFNHDGKPDYVLSKAATGETSIWYGSTFFGAVDGPTLPAGWAVGAVGDFNQDGKPDYVLFNAGTGRTCFWYLNGPTVIGWASGPTVPAGGWALAGVADFNRDGKPDLLLAKAATGETSVWTMDGPTFVSAAGKSTLPPGWDLVAP